VRTPISGTFPDRAHDFNWPNNAASQTVTVRTKPDILLRPQDYLGVVNATRGVAFDLPVMVGNLGDTEALDFSISVFLDGDMGNSLGHTDGVNIGPNAFTNTTVHIVILNVVGNHQLSIFADPHRERKHDLTGERLLACGTPDPRQLSGNRVRPRRDPHHPRDEPLGTEHPAGGAGHPGPEPDHILERGLPGPPGLDLVDHRR